MTEEYVAVDPHSFDRSDIPVLYELMVKDVTKKMRRASKKDSNDTWAAFNQGILDEAFELGSITFRYVNGGKVAEFREIGKPQVDFYISSGRWREIVGGVKQVAITGGAFAFLVWYLK